MKLLLLGGTRFLGRVLVEDALARGHDDVVQPRPYEPELFPEAEEIRGDRTVTLEPLAGRHWDATVDVATFIPHVVRISVDALRGHVDRVYVSSVSVYADQSVPPVEGAQVAELEIPTTRASSLRRAESGLRADRAEGVRRAGARRPA